jgi:hypothetical protein
MRAIVGLLLVAGLAVGAYYLWSSPQVRELFQPAGTSDEDPLAFLKEERSDLRSESRRAEPEKPSKSSRAAKTGDRGPATPPSVAQEATPSSPETPPLESNQQIARILIGILKAKGLASEISLSVTDSQIIVFGEVESKEEKEQILEVLNLGRGSRVLDHRQLTIASNPASGGSD